MVETKLTLPYPPSVNNYWKTKIVKRKVTKKMKRRPGLTSITYLSERARKYRIDVGYLVLNQLGRAPNYKGPVAVIVKQFDGPGNRQDIDNSLKSLFDALEHAKIYANDSQIEELLVIKKRRAAIGRVEITVRPLGV